MSAKITCIQIIRNSEWYENAVCPQYAGCPDTPTFKSGVCWKRECGRTEGKERSSESSVDIFWPLHKLSIHHSCSRLNKFQSKIVFTYKLFADESVCSQWFRKSDELPNIRIAPGLRPPSFLRPLHHDCWWSQVVDGCPWMTMYPPSTPLGGQDDQKKRTVWPRLLSPVIPTHLQLHGTVHQIQQWTTNTTNLNRK